MAPFQALPNIALMQPLVRPTLASPFTPNPNLIPVNDPTLKRVGRLWVDSEYVAPSRASDRWLEGDRNLPSLCLLFQRGQCKADANCNQLHVDAEHIKLLRIEANAVCMRNCCYSHGDQHACIEMFRVFLDRMTIYIRHGADEVLIPSDQVAATLFWDQFLSGKVQPVNGVLRFSSDRICRLHQRDSCRYGVDCNNIHVCREFWGAIGGPFPIEEKQKASKQSAAIPEGPRQSIHPPRSRSQRTADLGPIPNQTGDLPWDANGIDETQRLSLLLESLLQGSAQAKFPAAAAAAVDGSQRLSHLLQQSAQTGLLGIPPHLLQLYLSLYQAQAAMVAPVILPVPVPMPSELVHQYQTAYASALAQIASLKALGYSFPVDQYSSMLPQPMDPTTNQRFSPGNLNTQHCGSTQKHPSSRPAYIPSSLNHYPDLQASGLSQNSFQEDYLSSRQPVVPGLDTAAIAELSDTYGQYLDEEVLDAITSQSAPDFETMRRLIAKVSE